VASLQTQVLISGAGPTGLLLAAELRRRGIDCLLVEELDAPRQWDRATVIHPRSMEIFEALGIAEQFLDVGVRVRAARFESGGQMLGALDLELAGSRYGFDLGLSEETTERLLTSYLESLGGAVTHSTRLVRFVDGDQDVTASLERDGKVFEVSAQWLVGCDGLHSVVRQESGIEFPGDNIVASWAVFDATIQGWDRDFDVAAAFLDTPTVIMTPLPGRRWRVYMRPESDDGDLVAEASDVLNRYVSGGQFVEVENPARFHCHSRVATSYRSGRALLAGDAAHVCSPAEGHGMNTGLQDAFNLGWKLALVCEGWAGEGLLDSYEIERRPVAEQIVASGMAAEASEMLTEADDRSARNIQMHQLFGDAQALHHEAAAAAEINRSYADSPIVRGEATNGVVPGRLLPDTAPVEHPTAGSAALHQFAHGPGHTVIVLGGNAAGPGEVVQLVDEIDALRGSTMPIDAVLGFSSQPDGGSIGRIDESVTDQLGVVGVTTIAIRPDRYVGLRHDGTDYQALARYFESLAK
jgi:2-polyprenyl-6-methoxyphenol hydroxylase-like FAD-dependent oxidoreductase